jgi:hypothetical protein
VFFSVLIYRRFPRLADAVPHELGGANFFDIIRGSSDRSELFILGDFVDGGDRLFGGFRFGQVGAGDLEAVKHDACTASIEVVGRDALEDFADGVLDSAAIFRDGHGKRADALLAGDRIGDGLAGAVVEVAKVFVAERRAGAAVSVGEDVAALEPYFCAGI